MIVTGIVSLINPRRMFVDLLWVEDTHRNRGLDSW
jgi:hypothetical protein